MNGHIQRVCIVYEPLQLSGAATDPWPRVVETPSDAPTTSSRCLEPKNGSPDFISFPRRTRRGDEILSCVICSYALLPGRGLLLLFVPPSPERSAGLSFFPPWSKLPQRSILFPNPPVLVSWSDFNENCVENAQSLLCSALRAHLHTDRTGARPGSTDDGFTRQRWRRRSVCQPRKRPTVKFAREE